MNWELHVMSSKFLAYGPERHAVETVMRLHAVKRWHMIDTTRQQTLAEHSANVALLAMMIAKTAPINYFDDSNTIAAAALVHDIEEAFTGDIPSHTKKRLQGIDTLEKEVLHPAFKVEININSISLIKLCDLADGIRFVRLHGVDMTAIHAQEGLEDQMTDRINICQAELKWPSHVLNHVQEQIMFYAYENN
jgi:hypothetical protein